MPPRPPLVTIYHDPSSAVSRGALRIFKDQARTQRFRVDLVQSKTHSPSPEQITAICGYLGKGSPERGVRMLLTPRAPIVNTVQEAVEELKKNPMYLKKPLIVDWVQSRAVIADRPSF
ncbi:hypothetical protein B0O80DRAFT_424096 [Mortierella sp. GBAus27b]|nr:hypothetical protein B0O80DRAFT_424096 [Mortierella sp. GBAus27b]